MTHGPILAPTPMKTPTGITFYLMPCLTVLPAPTLLLLAMAGETTLITEPYCLVGRIVHNAGWNVVSLDLPCHGAQRRDGEPGELEGWAAHAAAGEDFVLEFQQRVNAVMEYLISTGIADRARLAAAGTSRGGFMALHAAAGNRDIRAAAAFAPVTDLSVLAEFAAYQEPAAALSLIHEANNLADRALWVTIGCSDARVDTDRAIAFCRAVARSANIRNLIPAVTLHVLPLTGHTSVPEWHYAAAEWLLTHV